MLPQGRLDGRRAQRPSSAITWEQHKLEEVSEVKTGFPFESSSFSDDGKWLVVTNGNVLAEVREVINCFGNRINPEQILIDHYGLKQEDILVTMDGDVGRSAKVADDNMVLAQRVARLIPFKNAEFIYQWLNSGPFRKSMAGLSHGGTIKHISLDEIGSYSEKIPVLIEEQQAIGALFQKLDHLITLHQRECSWVEVKVRCGLRLLNEA